VKTSVLAILTLGVATVGDVAHADTGQQLFDNNCAVCHQAGGVGVAGQFPRLAGRANIIAASTAGRAYLVQLLLNGMSGSVTVDGSRIMGVMPSFTQLSDADAASILTYVSHLNTPSKTKPVPFTAHEVASLRKAPRLSASDQAALRAKLASSGLIP
jgi:mono/diheme cytochrome c family protein